jgi:hypothetical protein
MHNKMQLYKTQSAVMKYEPFGSRCPLGEQCIVVQVGGGRVVVERGVVGIVISTVVDQRRLEGQQLDRVVGAAFAWRAHSGRRIA